MRERASLHVLDPWTRGALTAYADVLPDEGCDVVAWGPVRDAGTTALRCRPGA